MATVQDLIDVLSIKCDPTAQLSTWDSFLDDETTCLRVSVLGKNVCICDSAFGPDLMESK
jgi:hypothetical protein